MKNFKKYFFVGLIILSFSNVFSQERDSVSVSINKKNGGKINKLVLNANSFIVVADLSNIKNDISVKTPNKYNIYSYSVIFLTKNNFILSNYDGIRLTNDFKNNIENLKNGDNIIFFNIKIRKCKENNGIIENEQIFDYDKTIIFEIEE